MKKIVKIISTIYDVIGKFKFEDDKKLVGYVIVAEILSNTKQTVVNVGSVGRPMTKDPKACYCVATFENGSFSIEHRFIDYDREKIENIQKFIVKNYKLQDFVQKYKGGRRPGVVKKFRKLLLNNLEDFLRIIIITTSKAT